MELFTPDIIFLAIVAGIGLYKTWKGDYR